MLIEIFIVRFEQNNLTKSLLLTIGLSPAFFSETYFIHSLTYKGNQSIHHYIYIYYIHIHIYIRYIYYIYIIYTDILSIFLILSTFYEEVHNRDLVIAP